MILLNPSAYPRDLKYTLFRYRTDNTRLPISASFMYLENLYQDTEERKQNGKKITGSNGAR